MPTLGGTKVIAPIRPNDSLDNYPSHEAVYGKGGWRTVNGLEDRSAISLDRREEGMIVYVQSQAEQYQLAADLSSWTVFTAGGSSGGSATISNISSIGDVSIPAVNNGDILRFNGLNWIPVALSSVAATAVTVNYLTHEKNFRNHDIQGYDSADATHYNIGPLPVVDNTGNLVYS